MDNLKNSNVESKIYTSNADLYLGETHPFYMGPDGGIVDSVIKSFAGTLASKIGSSLVEKAFVASGIGSIGEFLGLVDTSQKKLNEILDKLNVINEKLDEIKTVLQDIKKAVITGFAKEKIENFWREYGDMGDTARIVYKELRTVSSDYEQAKRSESGKKDYNEALANIFKRVNDTSFTDRLLRFGNELIYGSITDGATITMAFYLMRTQEVKHSIQIIDSYLKFQRMILDNYAMAVYMASAGLKFLYETEPNQTQKKLYPKRMEDLQLSLINLQKYYYGQNNGKPELQRCRETFDVKGDYLYNYVDFNYGNSQAVLVPKNANLNNGVKYDYIYMVPGDTVKQELIVSGELSAKITGWDSEDTNVAVVNVSSDGVPMVIATGLGFTKIRVYTKYYEGYYADIYNQVEQHYLPEDKCTYFYVVVTPSAELSSQNYYTTEVISLDTAHINNSKDITELTGIDATKYNWVSTDPKTAYISGNVLTTFKPGKIGLMGTRKDRSQNKQRIEKTVIVDKVTVGHDGYYHVRTKDELIWSILENLPIVLEQDIDFENTTCNYLFSRDYTSHLNGNNHTIKNLRGGLMTINSGIIEKFNLENYRSQENLRGKYNNSSFIGLNYGSIQFVNILSGKEASICRLNFKNIAYCNVKNDGAEISNRPNTKIAIVNEKNSLIVGCGYELGNQQYSDYMIKYNYLVEKMKDGSRIMGCYNYYGTILHCFNHEKDVKICSSYGYSAIQSVSGDQYCTDYYDNCITTRGDVSSYGNKDKLIKAYIGKDEIAWLNRRKHYWDSTSEGKLTPYILDEYVTKK